MCGIAGMIGRSDRELLIAMRDSLRHRGPDAGGVIAWPGAGLAHRRLSIIDLAGGGQPMPNEDESVWVVFNGEIYNHVELRRQLEGRGHRFATSSDTEVIVHLYEDLGERCTERLRGDFAFAIWDRNREQLVLARDRLGVKPLYYAELPGEFIFASELKSLLLHPAVSRDVDLAAIDLYLSYFYIPAPLTVFRQIRKLPQASYGVYRRGRWSVSRYWSASTQSSSRPRSFSDAKELVRERLEDAVRVRLMSDVPLGAFLSGGIDSGSVVAMMAAASDSPVRTFTVRFPPDSGLYDEGDQARVVAQHLGTRHTELFVEANVTELLPKLVRHFDEPFGNPTALLLYQLSELTRQSVTVALAGDGGDELFGGYPRYRGLRWLGRYRRVPRLLRRFIRWILAGRIKDSLDGHATARRLREFLHADAHDDWAAYARWVGYFADFEKAGLYTSDFARQLPAPDQGEWLRDVANRVAGPMAGSQTVADVSRLDLETFLPENVLQYSDRMSMAHGLELRVPFTDHLLIEQVLPLRDSWKLGPRRGKRLLRAAVRDLLPASVLAGPKRGFNPPMAAWLRGSLKSILDDHLGDEIVRRRGIFCPQVVRHLREEFSAGRRDLSLHLWALVVLECWMRSYLDDFKLAVPGRHDRPAEPSHAGHRRQVAPAA